MQFNRHAAKRIREAHGISLAGVGRAIGKDRTLITRFENGERHPSVPDIVAIARAIRCEVADITNDPEARDAAA